ncbi:glycosyltransferase [Mariniflexile jejuense]|uniref:Glycosyltransferase n=1 Tax=Mariniflexile jejuense TaxID=1173582 RepID=A0ABW3JLV7_9FLAO
MKILLIGEYNSSHYTLKEGLEALNHEVLVVGMGDGFKKRMVDINLKWYFRTGFLSIIKKIIFRVFRIDLASVLTQIQFNHHKNKFKNFDVVQLINESPFLTVTKTETTLLSFIFKHNPNVFLLSCGTDYISVNYAYLKKFRYSILTPYFESRVSKKDFQHILMRIEKPYKNLHDFVYKNIKGIIASDLDYHIPLIENPKYLGLVPNPIQIKKLKKINLNINGKIVIFHGINRENYYKKGNDIFEAALHIIEQKYSNLIKIITVESLPYNEYITKFDEAHILLDQVYAYDQGFNALEAMAKGKVVFTGAEQEWLDYYNLKEDTVAINALPDAQKIAEKLEWLLLNPNKILEISNNAREFIEKQHNYIDSAKLYLEKWQSKI